MDALRSKHGELVSHEIDPGVSWNVLHVMDLNDCGQMAMELSSGIGRKDVYEKC